MTDKKKKIEISLVKIQEELFYLNLEFDASLLEPSLLKFTVSNQFSPDFEKETVHLKCKIQYLFEGKNKLSELSVILSYKISGLSDIISIDEEKNLEIKNNKIMNTLLATAIGTLRGVLYAKTKGTYLEAYPFPLLPISQFSSSLRSTPS